jgi:hypothetical protein
MIDITSPPKVSQSIRLIGKHYCWLQVLLSNRFSSTSNPELRESNLVLNSKDTGLKYAA